MKKQRPYTQIIAERAAKLVSFINGSLLDQKAAATYAANLYNEGCSAAHAISQGYKVGKRWKDQGVARHQNNVIDFRQRLAVMNKTPLHH